MNKLKHYDIIKTKDEGNCAIHSVLYGLQRVYTNERIVDILNQYSPITELVLDEEKPKIRYSTQTTNAVRQALYNYYHNMYDNIHPDLLIPDAGPSQEPHYKNIIHDKVWLTDIDLYYICKLFDICIKLRVYEHGKYSWRLFNPNIDINDIHSNTKKKFEEQCEKVIHIQFVNRNHFQLLVPNETLFKENSMSLSQKTKRQSSIQKTKKKYFNQTSKFQYPSRVSVENKINTETKSNNIILGGLALVGIGVGVLVAIS